MTVAKLESLMSTRLPEVLPGSSFSFALSVVFGLDAAVSHSVFQLAMTRSIGVAIAITQLDIADQCDRSAY